MPRIYRKSRRAQQEAATRQRIIEAAIELHAAGPASIAAIARRAGVGRVTVYRHFADEDELILACTSTFFAARPLPDPEAWTAIADPTTRVRHGLTEVYRYYADNEPLLATAEANAGAHPALLEGLAPVFATLGRMRDVLTQGWVVDPSRTDALLGAVGHAIAFGTWRSLVRDQRLRADQAVELMTALIASGQRVDAAALPASGGTPTRSRGRTHDA